MKLSINKTKKAISILLYKSGLSQAIVRYKIRNKILILSYHRVVPENLIDMNCQMPGMYISYQSLDLHLQWLKKNTNIILLDQVIELINLQQPLEFSYCSITFDDGWKDNYQYAFPILKSNQTPATIFLIGQNLHETKPLTWFVLFDLILNLKNIPDNFTGINEFDRLISKTRYRLDKARIIINFLRSLPYEKYQLISNRVISYYFSEYNIEHYISKYQHLSLDEVVEMSKGNISFGYHSYSHPMLVHLPLKDLIQEIKTPKVLLDKSINFNHTFCFPDGKYNEIIEKVLINNSYIGAVNLEKGFNCYLDNPYRLKRINIHQGSSSSLADFLFTILQN
jgi:peptidoglycan/xylan/chitin deacetylase (PgdA/CDA1 family)